MAAREVPWRELGLADRAPAWLDAAIDLVACLDADLRLIYTNLAFETATGCRYAERRGARLDEAGPFGAATVVVAALVDAALARPDTDVGPAELEWHQAGSQEQSYHQVSARAETADGAVARVLLTGRDVTQARRTEHTLLDREAEFRTLAENSPDNILRYDLGGYATYCNQEIAERVNTTARGLLGLRPTESAPPGSTGIEEYERVLMTTVRTGEPGRVDLTVLRPDGEPAIHSVLFRAERDASGEITGALAIGRDVTDLVEAQQAAHEREREFRTLAENAGDPIARWDTAGRLVYANPRMLEVLDLPPDALGEPGGAEVDPGRLAAVAAAVERVIAGGPAELVDERLVVGSGGDERVLQMLCVPERGDHGELLHVLGVGRDVTDAVRHREELQRLATTDLLTGLPNSQALYARGPGMLEAARRSGHRAAVLLFDLDGFKDVNDTLGHPGGDQVLRAVADQVRARLRSYDLLVRLGGDEFVVVVNDVDDTADLGALGAKILEALGELVVGPAARVGASIGVAVFPDDGETVEALLSNADIAMYQAKRAGRGGIDYFRPELSLALQRRAAIQRALEDPDLTDRLELHLQPVFWMSDPPRLRGAEALLRWTHPELGPVGPDEFIPVAEESGAIVRLGRWVLHEAAATVARWNRDRAQPDTLAVAVNVSTRQFVLDDVPAAFAEAADATGCSADWLVAEITESLLLEDREEVQTALARLRGAGVLLAIDDFGTGYSALHYLTRFPLDVLKIDRAFVQALGTAAGHDELVGAVVALARALDLRVVAEGIETEQQLALVAANGCELGQGFLLGRPLPVEQFEARFLADGASPGDGALRGRASGRSS